MPQRKLVSFGWAIKRLLRSKANFAILEGFLSELLRDDIHILEILDGESNQHTQDAKYNRVDIKVRNRNQEYCLIKVNQFDDIARDTLDEWIYFLKNETIEENFQAKGLKQAKEQLDVLKLSEEARRDYEAYQEDRRYQASMFNSSYGQLFIQLFSTKHPSFLLRVQLFSYYQPEIHLLQKYTSYDVI